MYWMKRESGLISLVVYINPCASVFWISKGKRSRHHLDLEYNCLRNDLGIRSYKSRDEVVTCT